MAVTYNLKGTTNPSFKIGKNGVVLAPADNTSSTTVTFPNATGTAALLESTQTFSGAITFSASGNSLLVDDTLRIAQSGSGLRMTNVGAFDNDGSDNFRVFATNDLFLKANGSTGGGLSIDATNQDVTVDNDLIVSGNLTVQGTTTTVDSTTVNIQNAFVFEGATADDFETTLTVTDPTADRTITLPNATGTVVLADATQTLTNKTLGATTISGHLTPSANVTYDLGTSSNRFRDIYLSGSTIDLGGAKLTNDGSDNLDIKDSSGNRKIIRASAIELVDSNGKKMKLERDATTGKLKKTRKNADDSDEGSSDTIDIVGDTSPQLGGDLDANGNDIDMGTNTITDTKVGQWDTAYGWGDHSTQSYLSGTVGFPTDLGAVTGSTTDYLGLGPDLGSIASGDTFVGLVKDFGLMGSTVTTTSTQTLTNKTLTSPTLTTPTFSGAVSGSVAIANTTTDDSLLITTTEDSSSAAPVITLKRNSSSVSDADYLGQLKFKGENDADQEIVYAKITGKIQDASDGTEDGIIEFANKKAGSNVITARLRSDSLQLLNSTGLTVAGDTTLSGTLNGHTIPGGAGTIALTSSFTHFHSSAQTVTSGEATTNASSTVDYTFSELSGAIHYVAFLNRTLMRASEYSVSGTTLTVNSGVLATDDQIEVTGISV